MRTRDQRLSDDEFFGEPQTEDQIIERAAVGLGKKFDGVSYIDVKTQRVGDAVGVLVNVCAFVGGGKRKQEKELFFWLNDARRKSWVSEDIPAAMDSLRKAFEGEPALSGDPKERRQDDPS